VVRTLSKKIDELETGVNNIVTPLVGGIVAGIPKGKSSISIDRFKTLLDEKIKDFSKESKSQFGLLSFARPISNFFVRNTLRIMRFAFIGDFLDTLEEKGIHEVSAQSVEGYAREKLVRTVVDTLKDRLGMARITVYALLALFLVVPIVLVVVL
jgi:hypothetical protein